MSTEPAPGSVRVDYDGHLAVITIDRADRLNAMSDFMEGQFWAAWEEVDGRDDVYCVLWRAEGRAFSAGRDVSELGNRGPGESDYQYIATGHAFTHRFLIPPARPRGLRDPGVVHRRHVGTVPVV